MAKVPHQPFLAEPSRLTLGEARAHVRNAIALAGLVMFASVPMYYFQFSRLASLIFKKTPPPEAMRALAVGQGLVAFSLALLCSLVGFMYAGRLALPGLGWGRDFRKWWLVAGALGAVSIPVSYFALDRDLLVKFPEFFPRPWPLAAIHVVGGALGQEVIARFGLITIVVYLLRWRGSRGHPWPATVIVSAFMTTAEFLYLTWTDIGARLEPWQLGVYLGMQLAFQVFQSEVYLRGGLLAAIAVHLALGLRLVVYTFL
jgi:hypothetical protein